MSFQVPCPVGSFGVGRGGGAGSSSARVPGRTEPLLWKRSPSWPFCWETEDWNSRYGIGGKNEYSVEIALSGKSPQTLNQGLSLALLWDMQRK